MTGNFQAPEESENAAGACTVPRVPTKCCFFYLFPALSEGIQKWGMPGDIFVLLLLDVHPHHQELSDVFVLGCVIF